MPQTPIHSTEKSTATKAHFHDCWVAEGGPGHALAKKLDEMKWFLAKLIGALTLIALLAPSAVALWIHYHPRQVVQAQASAPAALISQAHAEERKAP